MSAKIYELFRKGECGYDEADAMVVAAETAQDARRVASENAGDEGSATWLAASLSVVRELKPGGVKAGLILRSYNAG